MNLPKDPSWVSNGTQIRVTPEPQLTTPSCYQSPPTILHSLTSLPSWALGHVCLSGCPDTGFIQAGMWGPHLTPVST